MKSKINKESRNVIISLLIGDGTITSDNQMKLAHIEEQTEYLMWKIKLMNNYGIRNNGLKGYVITSGYSKGKTCVYTQLNKLPFIEVLRRIMYKNGKKVIANRKLLNRLDARGIAIWFMDDGHINIRKSKDKVIGFYIKISICRPKAECQVLIDYFKEVWNISFYTFHEGRTEDSFSLCCGTKEGFKFIDIVKNTINEIPSMSYKISYPTVLDERRTSDGSYITPKRTFKGNQYVSKEQLENRIPFNRKEYMKHYVRPNKPVRKSNKFTFTVPSNWRETIKKGGNGEQS